MGLGDIVSLAKHYGKKLSAEDVLGGDTAALASAIKVCFVCDHFARWLRAVNMLLRSLKVCGYLHQVCSIEK